METWQFNVGLLLDLLLQWCVLLNQSVEVDCEDHGVLLSNFWSLTIRTKAQLPCMWNYLSFHYILPGHAPS